MKRSFQLAGAILSIIVGGLAILGGFITLSFMAAFSWHIIVLISVIFVVLLGTAIVLLGALLCRKKNSKGIAIALLVLTAFTAVLQIVGTDGFNIGSVILIMLQLTAVAMLLVYLILKGKKEIKVKEVLQNINQTSVVQTDIEDLQSKQEGKINLLISLKESGALSEEDFKELLKKELEN